MRNFQLREANGVLLGHTIRNQGKQGWTCLSPTLNPLSFTTVSFNGLKKFSECGLFP